VVAAVEIDYHSFYFNLVHRETRRSGYGVAPLVPGVATGCGAVFAPSFAGVPLAGAAGVVVAGVVVTGTFVVTGTAVVDVVAADARSDPPVEKPF
jgi:hypothetical protein